MGKQYTFKTTKSTIWLEKVLDNMGSMERSEFIRSAIIAQLTNNSHSNVDRSVPMSDKRSDKVSDTDFEIQEMDKFAGFVRSDTLSDVEPDIDIIEEDSEDLDDKLDSISFG